MSFLGKALGEGAAAPIEAVGNIITGIWGDKGEKLDHDEVMARLVLQPQLAQTEINKVEAGHRSLFVAGWRPAIGWICVAGLAMTFIVFPLLQWFNPEVAMPDIATGLMMELVLGMLGLGALRTYEKVQGVTK